MKYDFKGKISFFVKILSGGWLLFVFLCLLGCASTKEKQSTNNDPLEKINRVTFKFNDKLDTHIFRPCAKVYNKILPRPLNAGLDHMYDNVSNASAIINDLLQFNFYQATSDTWRLCINTTVGIVGVFDVADPAGLGKNTEDFGLTLASWGYTDSTNFIVPFLGPKTIRDTISLPADFYISPYSRLNSVAARNTLLVTRALDKRAQLLRFQKLYDQMALDPYIFTRNAFIQHRNYRIERNKQLDNPYDSKEIITQEEDYYLDE